MEMQATQHTVNISQTPKDDTDKVEDDGSLWPPHDKMTILPCLDQSAPVYPSTHLPLFYSSPPYPSPFCWDYPLIPNLNKGLAAGDCGHGCGA